MVLKSLNRLLLILLLPVSLHAQNNADSLRSHGQFSGEWRTYYMATVNQGALKDFQALATGGYLKYMHKFADRIEVGGALYTSFNLNIQDLEVPDPVTGRFSRYETGQFDVTDFSNRAIFVLGELYAGYAWNSGNVRIGRMKIKTPFVNGQDGRMIPTMIQGIQVSQQINEKLKATVGIYNAIAPRSTEGFFRIGESIGKYPAGRAPDGGPSSYPGETESDFMLITDISWQPAAGLNFNFVDYFVQNVFHTLYIKPSYGWTSDGRTFTIEAEWLHQDRVGNGGNDVDELRYFTDASSNVLGFQLSTKQKTRWRLAYNRITADGRFLFPREWGREFLFTFQKRERSEGIADGQNLVAGITTPLRIGEGTLNTDLSLGRKWNSPVNDAAANKYAMPDYMHLNIDLAYSNKNLPRVFPELLVTYKAAMEDVSENPNLRLNKVEMWHFSLIFNYRFM